MKLIIHEIKPEEKEKLKEWGNKLMGERSQEAVESIRRENLARETVFIAEIEGKTYFIGIGDEKEDGEKAQDQVMPIDKEHREVFDSIFKETRVAKGELVYDIQADE